MAVLLVERGVTETRAHQNLNSEVTECTNAGIMCRIVLKVGMVGDSQIGKTSLMVKYVEGSFE